MSSLTYLIPLCWICFLAYWLISSRSVKPTQEKAFSTPRFRAIIITLLVIFIILNRLHVIPGLDPFQNGWAGCHLDILRVGRNMPFTNQVIGIFLTVCGLAVAVIARRTLAGNWSSNVEFKQGHELITYGIYGYVRHPIYSGMTLMLIGTIITFAPAGSAVIFVVFVCYCGYKMKLEEDLMLRHFPREYAAYRKRVKSLIPFIL